MLEVELRSLELNPRDNSRIWRGQGKTPETAAEFVGVRGFPEEAVEFGGVRGASWVCGGGCLRETECG